jgi:hypothetical protein
VRRMVAVVRDRAPWRLARRHAPQFGE